MTDFRQLEIWWVDLVPTHGAETRKKRPCLIVQGTPVNVGSRTLLVAPILPGHKNWPFVVNVKGTKQNRIDKDRHINLKQLRSVDISRIGDRNGVLESHYLKAIHKALRIVFSMDDNALSPLEISSRCPLGLTDGIHLIN